MNINFKHTIHSDYTNELNTFYNKFNKYVSNNDWVIDIGAGLGDTTLVLADLVGENGKVLAFEPAITYNLLIQNIERNPNLKNRINTYNVGAYNKYSIKKMATNPCLDNGGILDNLFVRDSRSQCYDVHLIDINDFINKSYSDSEKLKIKFIKIDTEGLDFVILNNLRPFLEYYKPVVFLEWWNNEVFSDMIFDISKQIGYNTIRDDNFQNTTSDEFNNRSENIILLPK